MSKREPPTNPTASLEPISRQLMSTCESGKPKGDGSQTKESVDEGNLQETKRKGVLEAERDKTWSTNYTLGKCAGFISYHRKLEWCEEKI